MVFDRVKKIVSEQVGVDEKEIKMESSFKDIGVDSLGLFEIIVSLEDEFDIEISNEDAEKLRTVEDVVKYIHENIK